ncbi:hypothetical protein [uncultured Roseobacter sp.]|uniref:hypothetical protein n=1 Tax=uncultured Roseobacter sp. TaxID=114847 RepID=UPI0026099FFF|nr:hypothetical protein [uncultured Roseobacter sp.]
MNVAVPQATIGNPTAFKEKSGHPEKRQPLHQPWRCMAAHPETNDPIMEHLSETTLF